jgi:hypothetical protein
MSTNFKVPPTGLNKDPFINPTTGRLYTQEELAALERKRPPPSSAGLSGTSRTTDRRVNPVSTDRMRFLHAIAPTEQTWHLRESEATSATLANARARAIRIYGEEFKRVRILLNIQADQQWEQHREHGPGPAQPQYRPRPRSHSPQHGPAQQRARPRSHSPEQYPAPKTKDEAFDILRIPSSSTKEEIRRAYLKRAMELHPDKNINNLEEANVRFQQLGAAINLINDLGQNGGRNKSYRVYRKLKKHIHHRRRNTRRRNTRHTKRSNKSSKSLKRYSKKHRR